ncbi:MAG: 3-isopropylmalate dehydratase large subunit [Pseudorhodoplanes sp.]|nr:3-isopropylmalate dehydratase large subunit [Pseudorhodoplanes sp.]
MLMTKPQTMFDKIWNSHVVETRDDGNSLLYIDRVLIHEVNSPQAFEAVRRAGEKLRRPEAFIAVADHDVPTTDRSAGIADERSRLQVEALERNCNEFGVTYFSPTDPRHGITHVIGPEQGFVLPGSVVVCCDSHAATYGALGALGFGIGASELEGVFRSQTLMQKQAKNMRITIDGTVPAGVSAKDMILAIIGKIGTAGGTGYAIEYGGSAVIGLTMESRMTLCNMSIEAGARAGMIAADDVTFSYLKGRPWAPKEGDWDKAVALWRSMSSDDGATYDDELNLSADELEPYVTWGISPQDVLPISGRIPDPTAITDAGARRAVERAIGYMALEPGQPLSSIAIDRVFIGSCTNSRIEDMREAARIARGRRVAAGVRAMIVPGSGLVKRQAEAEGLDRIFKNAGFEWRESGCSMCQAMNGDQLLAGERCASTSNRNFEHRQGRDSRTHLMSPGMAAAAAITGRLTDVRTLAQEGSN